MKAILIGTAIFALLIGPFAYSEWAYDRDLQKRKR